jgi:ABC-2 type transport system permease protein
MRAASATFVRYWQSNLRAYPWSFFVGNTLFGLILVAIAALTYGVLAGGRLGPSFSQFAGTSDYISYIVLGAAGFIFATRMLLQVSRCFITEHREGTLESLLLAPSSRASYLAGVAAQSLSSSAIELVVLLAIIAPFGLDLGGLDPIAALVVVPVAVVGIFGMAACLAAFMIGTGDTYVSQNTLFALMGLLSGFSFPPEYLPLPLQWAAMLLPTTGAMDLVRGALLRGDGLSTAGPELVWVACLGVAYLAGGLALLPRATRRALESEP